MADREAYAWLKVGNIVRLTKGSWRGLDYTARIKEITEEGVSLSTRTLGGELDPTQYTYDQLDELGLLPSSEAEEIENRLNYRRRNFPTQ